MERRHAAAKKLQEEVKNAKRAKAEDRKEAKKPKGSNCGDIVGALEEALLAELQTEEDPNVSFAVSLASAMKNLPSIYIRAFKLGTMQLLGI